MAASPARQVPTNSFHVIRTPIAVLTVAPFSPDREVKRLDYSARHRPATGHWGSIIPPKGAGFESEEPTSPEVGCMGQIKLKQKWEKASKRMAEKKTGRSAKGKLWRLKKLLFGSHGEGGDSGPSSVARPTDEGSMSPYPTLGQLKRYTSGSYDAKFGQICAGSWSSGAV